jgi:ABC-2 type transport system permease protein
VTVAVNGGVASARLSPRRRALWLLRHQISCDMRLLSRNRQSRAFAIALPIMLLVLFVAIFGNQTVQVEGHTLSESTYYVATLVSFGIVDTAFMTLAIGLVLQREAGILKRRRATPEPTWVLVGGRAVTTATGSLVLAGVLIAIGWIGYGATVPTRTALALAVAVGVGTAASCALGFAVTALVRSAESAQPVVTSLAMPLFFISGVFIPWPLIPQWLRYVAEVFPVRHLARALLLPFDPRTVGSGFAWRDLAVVAAWGLVGLAIALRRFSWAPRTA